jgi:hypothetical protein
MIRRLSIVMVGPIGFASQVAFVLHQGDGPGFSRCRRCGREVHGHPPGAGGDLPQRSVIVGVGPPFTSADLRAGRLAVVEPEPLQWREQQKVPPEWEPGHAAAFWPRA